MKTIPISKINIPLLFIVLLSLFTFAVTKAYFTASANSADNIFVSGDLELTMNQDSVLSVSNWQPGEVHVMEFDLLNSGDFPINIKGYLDGLWTDAQLEPTMVEITLVERLTEYGWVDITPNNFEIGEEFFVSEDGTENSVLDVFPQQQEHLRISVKLSDSVSDEYQNQGFKSSLHMGAKQVLQGASWPSAY